MSLLSIILASHFGLGLARSQITPVPFSYNVSGYDVSPDWSTDPFPPYPLLTDDSGSLIDSENVRGTRLFGYMGCSSIEKSIIDATFDDLYAVTHLDSQWANFERNEQSAQEIWGSQRAIPDGKKNEIRRML